MGCYQFFEYMSFDLWMLMIMATALDNSNNNNNIENVELYIIILYGGGKNENAWQKKEVDS